MLVLKQAERRGAKQNDSGGTNKARSKQKTTNAGKQTSTTE